MIYVNGNVMNDFKSITMDGSLNSESTWSGRLQQYPDDIKSQVKAYMINIILMTCTNVLLSAWLKINVPEVFLLYH